MSTPRVDAEAAIPSNFLDIVLIEDFELQSESVLQLLSPLEQHRGRTSDHDISDLFSKQEFSRNESRLDGFAYAHVIRDKEINPRKQERFPKRFKLVGIEPDPCAKR